LQPSRILVLGVLILIFLQLSNSSFSIRIEDAGGTVDIQTDMYELSWKKAKTMGYVRAKPKGIAKSLIQNAEDPFFHAGDYAGWEDWGETQKVNIQKSPGKAIIEYTSKGTKFMEYSCVATYWDGVPYFKHEVRAKNINKEAKVFPISGYDPMVNPNLEFGDQREKWVEPIPHIAYWNTNAYFGLYSALSKAKPKFGNWQGKGSMIQLDHDRQMALLNKKQVSNPVIYCISIGKGGKNKAHKIAFEIQRILAGADPQSVKLSDKLSTMWGTIKSN